MYQFGACKGGSGCEVGKRHRNYALLSGSVLSVWHIVEATLDKAPVKRLARMQVSFPGPGSLMGH